jgi:hypothetical protein
MNTKDKLRLECERLFKCETIYDSYDLLDIYTEFLFLTIKNHHQEAVYTIADADAKMIAQMMLTKTLHLKSVVQGITYEAKDGTTLNKIIDPTVVAILIRNIYETTALFNLLFRNTKTIEEKKIIHLLWVHSGLKDRQRFESVIITKERQEKCDREKKRIEEIVSIIEGSELYKNLDEKNQNKIKTKLKEKDYLIRFDNKEVVFLHWHELINIMGIKGRMENLYTYFSLYSHPSNVSVFQFADLFKEGENTFLRLTNFDLMNAFFLLSIFIADYIKLFPSVQNTFDNLNIRDQIVINFYNTFIRGMDYSINESWQVTN